MLKKLKEKLPEIADAGIPNQAVPVFRQLVSYIDNGLADSYTKSGDERASQLVTHLLNLRDFMNRAVSENGMRQVIVRDMLAIIEELEREELSADVDVVVSEEDTKKNEDYLTETSLLQEQTSGSDR